MIAETSGGGSKLFPEIRICFRSSRHIVLPSRVQAVLLSGLLAGTAACAYLGVSRVSYEDRLVHKTAAAVARAETAKTALRDQVGGLQHKLVALARQRDQAQSQASALASQAGALRGELSATEARLQSLVKAQSPPAPPPGAVEQPPPSAAAGAAPKANQAADLAKTLDQTQQALQQEKTQSAALAAQLDKIQADRAAEAAQLAQYKASLEETARELAGLGAVRGKKTAPRVRFRLRLGEIWQKLSQLRLPGAEPAAAPGLAEGATAAAAAPAADSGVEIARFGRKEAAAFVHALASAGVDVGRVLSQFGAAPAEGGPFVPPPKAGSSATDAISPEKLATLEGLAKTLPVTAPLVHYEIGSPFGVRTDPFNHRAGFHTGIDMDAPYKSPVYATAPGTVIYSGWLGDYGRVVEIDHGLGIVTLYAHLQRCLVAVGQKVAANAEIGLLGTTGRSTGPHVHYEVRVDGQPQDPEKFLGLARLLPAAGPQITPAAGGPAENTH
jgi:murein DD-endopeptidase MepM/ murein hydrolase activator NlpD